MRSTWPGRVPDFKFGSNDGWIVTADEARDIADGLFRLLADNWGAILHALSQLSIVGELSEEDARTWTQSWARYNDLAAGHGGYVVE